MEVGRKDERLRRGGQTHVDEAKLINRLMKLVKLDGFTYVYMRLNVTKAPIVARKEKSVFKHMCGHLCLMCYTGGKCVTDGCVAASLEMCTPGVRRSRSMCPNLCVKLKLCSTDFTLRDKPPHLLWV